MNNEDFVSYEQAVKLKKLGFECPCYAYYTKEDAPDDEAWFVTCCEKSRHQGWPLRWLAPSLWQVQKWLRERGLCVSVYPSPFSEDINGEYAYKVYQFMDYEEWNDPCAEYANDYNIALSAGIEAALKLIETDKTKKL